jgi:hypothetical protein
MKIGVSHSLLLWALLTVGGTGLRLRLLAGSTCPFVPPFGNPINILNVYFARLASSLKPTSTDNFDVMYVNLQTFDFPVLRYVFRYTQKTNGRSRQFFIGILSTLSSFEELKNPDAVHSVIRYVMTSDIIDTQRILGDYSMKKDDTMSCGDVKKDFTDYSTSAPIGFDAPAIGKVDVNEVVAWVTQLAMTQNGGSLPATVDFPALLAALQAYKGTGTLTTNIKSFIPKVTPSILTPVPTTQSTVTTHISKRMPMVQYHLRSGEVLKGDGSSLIRGNAVRERMLRHAYRGRRHHSRTAISRKHPQKSKRLSSRHRRHPGHQHSCSHHSDHSN